MDIQTEAADAGMVGLTVVNTDTLRKSFQGHMVKYWKRTIASIQSVSDAILESIVDISGAIRRGYTQDVETAQGA